MHTHTCIYTHEEFACTNCGGCLFTRQNKLPDHDCITQAACLVPGCVCTYILSQPKVPKTHQSLQATSWHRELRHSRLWHQDSSTSQGACLFSLLTASGRDAVRVKGMSWKDKGCRALIYVIIRIKAVICIFTSADPSR